MTKSQKDSDDYFRGALLSGFFFLVEEANGLREWAKSSGAGYKATAIGLGGSIILSGRRIEMKGV